jgi:hypothetical protein
MNSIELHSSLKPTPLTEFSSYFTDFRKSAFRLELLSVYNVPQEEEPLREFAAGKLRPPSDYNHKWRETIATAKSTGKDFSRVRVIDGPLSSYLRFEIMWPYSVNVPAGEDIRFIIRKEIGPFATTVPILKDYWLFDESVCFLMDYDYRGTFLGVAKLPDDITQPYIELMHEAKESSIEMSEALKHFGM